MREGDKVSLLNKMVEVRFEAEFGFNFVVDGNMTDAEIIKTFINNGIIAMTGRGADRDSNARYAIDTNKVTRISFYTVEREPNMFITL